MSLSQGMIAGLLFAMSADSSGITAVQAAAGGVTTVLPGQDPFLAHFLIAKIGRQVAGSTVLLRHQATETAARTLGSGFIYLHFASHGVFDPENPLDSALLLVGDDRNDGRLTVAELYETRMDADLITLSACETALGKITNGDGPMVTTWGALPAAFCMPVPTALYPACGRSMTKLAEF